MDPVTIGAIASVAVAYFSKPKGGGAGGGGAITPQQSNPLTNSWLDSSGWVVATNGSSAKGGDRDQSSALGTELSPLIVGAALLAFIVWTKANKKTLTWANVPWSEEALEHLGAILAHDTCGGLRSMAEIVNGAHLFEAELAGAVVGRYALKVNHHAHGLEAVIVAAAGHAPGIDLTVAGITDAELRCVGADALMVNTRRLSLVKKLARLGFTIDGFILRKKIKRAH